MKKFICLFLMLWLPISANAAWAMSTQMQMNAASDATIEVAMEMPCHDMTDDNSGTNLNHEPGIKHNCSACGACFTVLATGTPLAVYFSSAVMTSRAALPADDQIVSPTYPPALRPPIAS
ncbi:MAG TPA: hypothetical protein VFF75_03785 [Methylophilaceae bacterium]|nr:hypothetical protein [Methylophilaceae bacterium]